MKPKDRFGKKMHRKGPKNNVRISVVSKGAKRECCVCGRVLHGTPNCKRTAAARKLSKTEKRPSAMFAGILCNKCRAKVLEEALKIKYAGKKSEESSIRLNKFVSEALKKTE